MESGRRSNTLLEYVKVEDEEEVDEDDEEGEVNIAIIASNPRPHRTNYCDGTQGEGWIGVGAAGIERRYAWVSVMKRFKL